IYISPAPGISDAINTKKPCFCFVISILLLLLCYWGSPPDSLQFYQNPAKYHFPEPGKTFPDRTDGPAYTAPRRIQPPAVEARCVWMKNPPGIRRRAA